MPGIPPHIDMANPILPLRLSPHHVNISQGALSSHLSVCPGKNWHCLLSSLHKRPASELSQLPFMAAPYTRGLMIWIGTALQWNP